MPALPSIAGEFTTRGVTAAERIEAVKWFGVLLMLIDHAAKYLQLAAPGWQVLGRGAFPLFALAFGYALAVAPDVRSVLRRLLAFALAAEAMGAWSITRGMPLNVLFSFALSCQVVHAARAGASPWRWARLLVLVWIGAHFVEYGAAGVLLTLAAWWFWRAQSWTRLVVLVAASVPLVIWNYTLFASAWLIVGVAVCFSPIGFPRVRRVFYWVYTLQWPLLWVLR